MNFENSSLLSVPAFWPMAMHKQSADKAASATVLFDGSDGEGERLNARMVPQVPG
jgi:hypothetical protein